MRVGVGGVGWGFSVACVCLTLTCPVSVRPIVDEEGGLLRGWAFFFFFYRCLRPSARNSRFAKVRGERERERERGFFFLSLPSAFH